MNGSRDKVRMLLVGHSLEAKCNVANAITRQDNTFKVMSCRMRSLVKSVHNTTITGQLLQCVVTPNLDTPAWSRSLSGLSQDLIDVLIYVKTHGIGDVDDEASMDKLKKSFERKPMVSMDYFTNRLTTDPEKECYMHFDMTFSERCDAARKVLVHISKSRSLANKFPTNADTSSVPDKKYSNKIKQDRDVPAISKLQFTTEEKEKVQVVPSKLTLPALKNEDWALLAKALRIGKASSSHIRVNVVGNQSVGKTTLVKRLQRTLATCARQKTVPTEALDIEEVTLRCVETENGEEWEMNEAGYADLLNKQRMAEAISSVSDTAFQAVDVAEVLEEDDTYDIQMGSDAIDDDEDITILTINSYRDKTRHEERVQFLKEVIFEKNQRRKKQVYISFWDFAGQSTYYSTHQAFLSKDAVYIIAFDLSKDLDSELKDSLSFRIGRSNKCTVRESLVFWASSIKAFTVDRHGGRAPIIIVGTHGDKVDEEQAHEKFQIVRKITKLERAVCLRIDNTKQIAISEHQRDDPDDLKMLRKRILDLGLGISDEKVDARWIDLGNALMRKKMEGKKVITFGQLEELNIKMDMPLQGQDSIRQFLEHLHCRGQILYFPQGTQNDLVILQPTVLSTFLNSLMRTSQTTDQSKSNVDATNDNGMVSQAFVMQVAESLLEADDLKKNAVNLLTLLSTLKITFECQIKDQRAPIYILPSLLPEYQREAPNEKGPVLKIDFRDDPVPVGFYHLLMTTIVTEIPNISISTIGNRPAIFNRHAFLSLHDKKIMVDLKWEGSTIYIDINNYSRKYTLRDARVHDFIRRLKLAVQSTVDIYRHYNVDYFLGIGCPKHADSFHDVDEIEDNGTFVCQQRHLVEEFTFLEQTRDTTDKTQSADTGLKNVPKGKHLGRIARYITSESPATLAVRLKMTKAIAAEVEYNHNDVSVQRLYILYRWKQKNPKITLGDLIKQLSETGDFDGQVLGTIVLKTLEMKYYGLPIKTLATTTRREDIALVSYHIGPTYPLLMTELGLTLNDIEVARADYHQDMKGAIKDLLYLWKRECQIEDTLHRLLSTMDNVGISTRHVVETLKSRI